MKSWTKSSIEKDNYANIPFNDLLNSEDAVKEVVKSLITFGVAFINKVPPTTDMTEMTIRRYDFPRQVDSGLILAFSFEQNVSNYEDSFW